MTVRLSLRFAGRVHFSRFQFQPLSVPFGALYMSNPWPAKLYHAPTLSVFRFPFC